MTDALARQMSERQLQAAVADLCRVLHVDYYHTHRSDHSPAGFPDCVMIRKAERIGLPSTVVVAELKSERGRLTDAQRAWLASFESAGIPAHVWRPTDWHSGLIERVLTGDES